MAIVLQTVPCKEQRWVPETQTWKKQLTNTMNSHTIIQCGTEGPELQRCYPNEPQRELDLLPGQLVQKVLYRKEKLHGNRTQRGLRVLLRAKTRAFFVELTESPPLHSQERTPR